MAWQDKYDKINMNNEGEVVIFGEHVTLERAKEIIEEENYDDPDDYIGTEEIWLRFCRFNYEGEMTNGWLELDIEPKSKPGTIKATKMLV